MNEFQKELVLNLKKFCESSIEPHMEHDDASGTFRKEIFQGLGEYGVTGITIPEEFGGAGCLTWIIVMHLKRLQKRLCPTL